jgi:hypothetical protein
MAEPITLPSFEELAAIAKDDPDQLSQLRQDLCEEFITSCSSAVQPRLQAQQSHIERVLTRAKNPTHANVLLRKELHKQVVKLADRLKGDPQTPQQSAEIIPFEQGHEWR